MFLNHGFCNIEPNSFKSTSFVDPDDSKLSLKRRKNTRYKKRDVNHSFNKRLKAFITPTKKNNAPLEFGQDNSLPVINKFSKNIMNQTGKFSFFISRIFEFDDRDCIVMSSASSSKYY